MKRQALFLAAALTAAALSGCSTTDNNGGENSGGSSGTVVENVVPNHGNTQQNTESSQSTASGTGQNEETNADLSMGIGIVSRLKRAQDASESDGSAEINTIVAAVTLDAEGRIMDCKLDKVENKLSISNTGAIGSPSNTEYSTAKELKDKYGMKEASPIGKEWYEQIAAFEQYVAGKTVDEVNGIKTDNQGYVQENDWNSSVTISISDFQAAIAKAAENAS